jgi:hypothetical protein
MTDAPKDGFARCAGHTTRNHGYSPLSRLTPRKVLALNRRVGDAAGRGPHGGTGIRPAITQTYRGVPMGKWGWLSARLPDLDARGRPVTVQRGDLLRLPATAADPEMLFLVLFEEIPNECDDTCVRAYGWELTGDLRAVRRREVRLALSEPVEPVLPQWRIAGFDPHANDLDAVEQAMLDDENE